MAIKKKTNIFKKIGSALSQIGNKAKGNLGASAVSSNKQVFKTLPNAKLTSNKPAEKGIDINGKTYYSAGLKDAGINTTKDLSIALYKANQPKGTGNSQTVGLTPGQFGASTTPAGLNIKKGNNTPGGKNNPVITPTDTTAFSSPLSLNRTAGASQGTQTGANNVITGTGAVTGGLTNVDNSLLKNISDPTFPEKTATEVPTIYQQPITEQQNQNEFEKAQKDYLANLAKDFKNKDTGAELYKKAQEETQILQKQQKVNELTGKLNAIVAKGEANQLSLIGQGRGIPEAIIGGQQDQIGRETAIAALPVQAQLDAAQGDLQSAEANLNTLFKIYSDDAKNEYEYKKSVRDAIYGFASEKYKTELDKINKQKDREYEETRKDIDAKRQIAIKANAQGASSTVIDAIGKAKTFEEALQIASPFMKDTQIVKLDNGNTIMVDSRGNIVANLGGGSTSGYTSMGSGNTVNFDDANTVAKLPISKLTKAVISGFGSLKDLTPTDKSKVIEEMYQVGYNPQEDIFKKLNELKVAWEAIPQGKKGLINSLLTPFAVYNDPTVSEFNSAKTILTRKIARLNDVGVLSDQDVKSYKDAMPDRRDASSEVVQGKIDGIFGAQSAINSTPTGDARSKIINAGYNYDAIKADNPNLTDSQILQDLGLQ